MPLLHVFILALIQGITEFLPVSSSGHLVLAWEAFDRLEMDVTQQTFSERLTMDVAVHVGTLFAVCLYFYREIGQMIIGLVRRLMGQADPGANLAAYVVIGSVPLGLVGFYFEDAIGPALHNPQVVAWTSIGFGVLLYISDRMGMTIRKLDHMNLNGAVIIGLAQVLALFPGVSRSGITMTAARFLGFEPAEAARFSLLLAIPAIAGAGLLRGLELWHSENLVLGLEAVVGVGVAFVFALIAIVLMIGWLRRASFTPFVVYRIVLGVAVLWWVHNGV